MLLERLIGFFLDQVEDDWFGVFFAPWTPVQSHIFGLGLPIAGSPAPSPVTPRHRSMTAGSDDCTICLPVDCEGQEEWHMTTVGLEEPQLLREWEPNPQGRKF